MRHPVYRNCRFEHDFHTVSADLVITRALRSRQQAVPVRMADESKTGGEHAAGRGTRGAAKRLSGGARAFLAFALEHIVSVAESRLRMSCTGVRLRVRVEPTDPPSSAHQLPLT